MESHSQLSNAREGCRVSRVLSQVQSGNWIMRDPEGVITLCLKTGNNNNNNKAKNLRTFNNACN